MLATPLFLFLINQLLLIGAVVGNDQPIAPTLIEKLRSFLNNMLDTVIQIEEANSRQLIVNNEQQQRFGINDIINAALTADQYQPAQQQQQQHIAQFGPSAPPLSDGAQFGSNAPPLSDGAQFGSSAPPLSDGAQFGSNAPPLSDGAQFGPSAPPLSDDAQFGPSAPPLSDDAQFGPSATPLSDRQKRFFSETSISRMSKKWLKFSLDNIKKHCAKNWQTNFPNHRCAQELIEKLSGMLKKLADPREKVTCAEVNALFDEIIYFLVTSVETIKENVKTLEAYNNEIRFEQAFQAENENCKRKKTLAKFDKAIYPKKFKGFKKIIIGCDVDMEKLEHICNTIQTFEVLKCLASEEKQKHYAKNLNKYLSTQTDDQLFERLEWIN